MTIDVAASREARRQSALDALRLDASREAFPDAVATAAAAIANVPMAGVSLVDRDRAWFKSACAMPPESPRRDAFCAHAIRSAEPLVVPDATADPRFATLPAVAGAPHVRFYAGFPLVVGGEAVGVLCVVDDRVRTLGAEPMARLRLLADATASWLADKRA